jgi:hypothetical protein
MSDADLLVAPSDALKARDILVREGFSSMPLKSPLYRHIILDLGNHLRSCTGEASRSTCIQALRPGGRRDGDQGNSGIRKCFRYHS